MSSAPVPTASWPRTAGSCSCHSTAAPPSPTTPALRLCTSWEKKRVLRDFQTTLSCKPDVVFGCEDKLIVENPLRLVVKAGAGVKLDNLEEELSLFVLDYFLRHGFGKSVFT